MLNTTRHFCLHCRPQSYSTCQSWHLLWPRVRVSAAQLSIPCLELWSGPVGWQWRLNFCSNLAMWWNYCHWKNRLFLAAHRCSRTSHSHFHTPRWCAGYNDWSQLMLQPNHLTCLSKYTAIVPSLTSTLSLFYQEIQLLPKIHPQTRLQSLSGPCVLRIVAASTPYLDHTTQRSDSTSLWAISVRRVWSRPTECSNPAPWTAVRALAARWAVCSPRPSGRWRQPRPESLTGPLLLHSRLASPARFWGSYLFAYSIV